MANYFLPIIIKDLWFVLLIILYLKSNDEPFWLALILILNDGFAGFLGHRGVQIESLGLPAYELGHIYLIAMVAKASFRREKVYVFHSKWMIILFMYVILLLIVGVAHGLPEDYSLFLRNLRNVFPLLLIYFIPRLLTVHHHYERFFSFVFLIAIIAFFTQLFSVLTGTNPMAFLGIREGRLIEDLELRMWRGFYNVAANLLAFFAAMFYLTEKNTQFNSTYLRLILVSVCGTVFLSATRGWMLGFGMSLILFFVFAQKVNIKQIAIPILIASAALNILMLQPRMRIQLNNAFERLKTVEALAEGDLSAGGTSSRATERGPNVMSVWAERPLIGWGYSTKFYEARDGHVGNESILLHSGIVGAALLVMFFWYYFMKLYFLSVKTRWKSSYSSALLVFPSFFIGLLIIHSTSGQVFGYHATYMHAIALGVFFGFGATIYRKIRQDGNA